MSNFNVAGNVRRSTWVGPGTDRDMRQTVLESLVVAQYEPYNALACAAGRRFMGGFQATATALTPVTAIPTTAAALCLYNTEPGGGKSLVIDRLNFWLASGTAPVGATLLAAIGTVSSPPAAAANYSSGSCSGHGASTARWASGITLAATPAWCAMGSNIQSAGTTIGLGDSYIEVAGGLIVPPGQVLALTVLSGAGTSALYGVHSQWLELDVDLE